jgi:hypothetical protein
MTTRPEVQYLQLYRPEIPVLYCESVVHTMHTTTGNEVFRFRTQGRKVVHVAIAEVMTRLGSWRVGSVVRCKGIRSMPRLFSRGTDSICAHVNLACCTCEFAYSV